MLVVHARQDVLVQLSGHLDLEGRSAFDGCVAMALAGHPRQLVLDLSGLASTDLNGVDCLTSALHRAEEAGVRLVLDAPNEQVIGMLERANIAEDFSIR